MQQLLVVLFIVGIAFIFLILIGMKHRNWNFFVSGAAAGMSLISMLENKFWSLPFVELADDVFWTRKENILNGVGEETAKIFISRKGRL